MSEHDEQVTVVQWCDLHRIPVVHVPNGGWRTKTEAARLKRAGVRPGFPDLFVPMPRHGYSGLFIELKDVGGRPPRPNQVEWLEKLNELGYLATWSRGADAAIDMIRRYCDVP